MTLREVTAAMAQDFLYVVLAVLGLVVLFNATTSLYERVRHWLSQRQGR